MSALDEVVRACDPSLHEHAAPDPGPGCFADTVTDPNRLFVLEAVYEGYLMHYGRPRAFAAMDPDLRLLAGDSLYALGLSRLAATGDLEAVGVLADLISDTARAQAEGRAEEAEPMWLQAAERLG